MFELKKIFGGAVWFEFNGGKYLSQMLVITMKMNFMYFYNLQI